MLLPQIPVRYDGRLPTIVERSQIMHMGSCPLAIDKVFNNVDGLCLLHDLVGASVPGKELITSANRRCEELL